MAQTGYTPISIYYSSTAGNTPTSGNLVAGELAINTADGKLFYKDSSGVVQTIASKDTFNGNFSTISVSGNSYLATASGNAAVGTTATTYNYQTKNLVVYDGVSAGLQVVGAGTVIELVSLTGQAYMGTRNNIPLNFVINDATKATISTSGAFSVGYIPTTNIEKINISSSSPAGIGFNSNSAYTAWQTAKIAAIDEGASFKGSLAFYTHASSGSGGAATERMRITSDGYVGIATTSPNTPLTVSGSGGGNTGIVNIIGADGVSSFSWTTQSYNSSLKVGGNQIIMLGQSAGANQAGYFGFNNAVGGGSNSNFVTLGLYGNDNLLNINAYGNTSLKGATTSANGTGITFPASQSASTDANCLDDYEEGTWTPTYAASSGSMTYSQQLGYYTKIGRVVTIYCHIVTTANNGLNGNVAITGLPFTAAGNYCPGPVHAEQLNIAASVWIWGYVIPSGVSVGLRYWNNNAPAAFLVGSQLNNGSDFMYAATYITS